MIKLIVKLELQVAMEKCIATVACEVAKISANTCQLLAYRW